MSTSEQERVRRIKENMFGRHFVWDPANKTVNAADYKDPDDPSLRATEADLGHAFCYGG